MKNRLMNEQPIAYKTLTHCIKRNKLSHALMFTGEKGTPMLQAAIFVAQCKVCGHDELACGVCDECKRIKDGTYSDFILLDGSKSSIKKEEVLKLQDSFQKTALEKSGEKIYIINRAENATPAALNSLLKFLEEPQGNSTTAILIVEEEKRILPTVLSRCQIIPFRTLTANECYQKAVEEGLNEEDSIILSHFIRDVEAMNKISEEESYQKAILGVKHFLGNIRNLDQVMVWLDVEIFNSKDSNKETFIYFIDILMAILQDAASNINCQIQWIQDGIQDLSELNINLSMWMLNLLETKDKCKQAFNLGLLINQCILKLKEEF